jgi:hypothetical protein
VRIPVHRIGAATIADGSCASVSGVEESLEGRFMTRAWFFAVLSIAILCAAVPSQARDDRNRGNDACTADSAKLCKKFFGQGDMVILKCFQDNRTRLSGKCQKFLTEVGLLN